MRTTFALITLLFFSLPTLVLATDIRKGEQIRISTPVHEDLYVGATKLQINAPVFGDLIAAARFCYVQDTLHEDAIIMAQELYLEAPVMDDARLIGGQIHIRADVFGDLFLGGGTVYIEKEVTIHGNLYAGGSKVHLYGTVMGDIELAGGEVFFEGTAEQGTNIKAGLLHLSGTFRGPVRIGAETIILASQAAFYEDIHYWTEQGPVDFRPNQKSGGNAVFDASLQTNINDHQWRSAFGIGSFIFNIGRILSAALLLIILVWAFQRFFRRTARHLTGHYATSLGYGMLYLLGVPLLILIALVSIIGIPVGIFSLATYGLSLGFAHILAAVLVTYWWQEYKGMAWPKSQVIFFAIGVFILLKLISWIPLIGWLVSMLVVATTFGAILSELLHRKVKPVAIAPTDADEMEV